jgi:hypothetical protein
MLARLKALTLWGGLVVAVVTAIGPSEQDLVGTVLDARCNAGWCSKPPAAARLMEVSGDCFQPFSSSDPASGLGRSLHRFAPGTWQVLRLCLAPSLPCGRVQRAAERESGSPGVFAIGSECRGSGYERLASVLREQVLLTPVDAAVVTGVSMSLERLLVRELFPWISPGGVLCVTHAGGDMAGWASFDSDLFARRRKESAPSPGGGAVSSEDQQARDEWGFVSLADDVNGMWWRSVPAVGRDYCQELNRCPRGVGVEQLSAAWLRVRRVTEDFPDLWRQWFSRAAWDVKWTSDRSVLFRRMPPCEAVSDHDEWGCPSQSTLGSLDRNMVAFGMLCNKGQPCRRVDPEEPVKQALPLHLQRSLI